MNMSFRIGDVLFTAEKREVSDRETEISVRFNTRSIGYALDKPSAIRCYRFRAGGFSRQQLAKQEVIFGEQKMNRPFYLGINIPIESTVEFKTALKSRQISAKVTRLANMPGKSFRFRLGAILAADSRPGNVWA